MISLPMFGDFERNECIKFVRLGMLFSLIIGAYWSLGMLKQAIFSNLVGAAWGPYARVVSMLGMIFVLMLYTKLLDRYTREKIFYVLSALYVFGITCFSLALLHPSLFQSATHGLCTSGGIAGCAVHIFSYAFAFFCDSYVLLIALFWAMVTDITLPESAKKGFSLIVAVGQLGGVILPYVITQVPVRFGLMTNSISVLLCTLPVICSVFVLHYFMRNTPKDLLLSFHGVNEKEIKVEKSPGFFEGLRLITNHAYLLGIFCVVVFPDILATIFDLHFGLVAEQQYPGVALAGYLGMYGSAVNGMTLLFLLLGINTITRKLGVGIALMLMSLIFAGALFGFIALDSINFLFALMVSIKAINYALSVPAIKQLYIPTMHDTRFKAQAWIEAFGPNTSKLSGSFFNMTLAPLQSAFGKAAGKSFHILISSYFGFALVIVWICVAFGLGKIHKKAIDQNKVVC
jgi:AAA family ATP:ADP antiporter